MFKKKRKGFTLVELLVVIAILAILATVSVVGYTKFTKKAKQSNDVSLTTQINTALQADEITGKPATLTEALKIMDEVGANISRLSPTTDNYSYVWNSKTNRVILLDDKKDIVAPEGATIENKLDCFAIIHKAADRETWKGYSYYLAYDYDETSVSLSYLAGIDVGTNNIETISISDTNATGTAIVYTTNGTLTINAPKATINHYGVLNEVNITAIAGDSYHEYGKVIGKITLSEGSVKTEAGSSVSYIVVAEDTNVSVNVNSKSNVTYIVASAAAQEFVTAGSNTKVVASTDETALSKFDGGLGTSENPYLISDATQFANIADTQVSGTNFKLTSDVTISGSVLPQSASKITNIDLNNCTMTANLSIGTTISDGNTLSLSNGELVYNRPTGSVTSVDFEIIAGSSIKLDGVKYISAKSALYPRGDAATVEVINSEIQAACYCVATNAGSTSNYNVKIVLKDSKFVSTSSDYDNTAVFINIPGTLTMDNCEATADRQVVLVRCGTANISNCKINLTGNVGAGLDEAYLTSNWGGGNNLPAAAIVIGNRHASSYKNAANCTLTNVTITASGRKMIYMSGNTEEGIGANLNFDAACNFTKEDIVFDAERKAYCTINGVKAA